MAIQTLAVLANPARQVAGSIAADASQRGLTESQRPGAEACVRYRVNKKEYLRYQVALESGWPVVTGVVEGACRHLICDRLDITGSRWASKEPTPFSGSVRAVVDNENFAVGAQAWLCAHHGWWLRSGLLLRMIWRYTVWKLLPVDAVISFTARPADAVSDDDAIILIQEKRRYGTTASGTSIAPASRNHKERSQPPMEPKRCMGDLHRRDPGEDP